MCYICAIIIYIRERMVDKKIILQKGETIKFLDYFIVNSLNEDGLVLLKNGGQPYESHLGNYGDGTQENIDACKKDAILYFMAARPHIFATTLIRKARTMRSGTYHEYYLFAGSLQKEEIAIPSEITCGDGSNCIIYFNNQPLN